MKKTSTLFLKVVILLIVISVLVLLITFPQTEGRATNLDLINIYKDPFVIYIYLAAIPFFVALYQAFKVVGFVEKNKISTQVSVNAVRTIKYCALTVIGFMIGAEAFLFIVQRGKSDDIAGGVAMGVFITLIFVVIATAAAVFQKFLQKALKLN